MTAATTPTAPTGSKPPAAVMPGAVMPEADARRIDRCFRAPPDLAAMPQLLQPLPPRPAPQEARHG